MSVARYVFVLVVLAIGALFTSQAYAQATRTWVSGVGDDANPCSRTAPCKTFAGAISKTAANGTINALDPGGFGAVTITKAITIEAVGNVASILVAGTNGIVVNAGASDTVALRGLTVEGTNGSGINGIRFLNGGKLIVERCVVQGFSASGIDFEPSAASKLVVTDTTVDNSNLSSSNGILVSGSGATPAAALNRVRIVQNGYGLQVTNGIVNLRDSTISQNNVGIKAVSSTTSATISIDNSEISGSAGAGVVTSGSVASIVISRSVITGNLVGIGGNVTSFGDNRIFNNTLDGTPSGSPLPLH